MKKLLILFFVFLSTHTSIAQPNIQLQLPDSGCVGSIFPFTAYVYAANDSALTFTWEFGDGTPVVVTQTNSTNHQYNSTGIFTVQLIVNLQVYGPDTITVPGMIRTGTAQNAQIDFVPDTICFKSSIQFHDLSTGSITGWYWYFGDGAVSTDKNPVHEYNIDTSGTANPFDIILTVFNNGCADSDSVFDMISVHGPIPNFQTIHNCEVRDSFIFINQTGGGNLYTWDFGDGSPLSNDTNTYHLFPSLGSPIMVTLTATNTSTGCVADTVWPIQFMQHVTGTIYESNGALFSPVSTPSYNYGWYCSGQFISNYPGPYCVPVQSGNYVVLIIDPSTGCADTSAYYSFSLGIENVRDIPAISVYPNPNSGSILYVTSTNGFTKAGFIRIYNSYGKLVIDLPLSSASTGINTEKIPAGIYFIEVMTESVRQVIKIIRN